MTMNDYFVCVKNNTTVPIGSVSLVGTEYKYTKCANGSTISTAQAMTDPIGTVSVTINKGLYTYGVKWNCAAKAPSGVLYTLDNLGKLKDPTVFSSDFLQVKS